MNKETIDIPNNLKVVEKSYKNIKTISDRTNMPKLTSVYSYNLPTNQGMTNYSGNSNSSSNDFKL